MTRDVTKGNGGPPLTEAPTLSPELRKILGRRKIVTNYGGDDGMSSGGADFRDGVWDAPEFVDAREREEARKALSAFEMQLRPLSHDRIREFLLMLWGATKHQNDVNWDAVSVVYPTMLDAHPAWCFRRERLILAAQHAFQWFPSVQELVAFMEPDRQFILGQVNGLKTIAHLPTERQAQKPGVGRSEFKWSFEEAEAQTQRNREAKDRERKETIEILRRRDEADGVAPAIDTVPPRASDETEKEYVARLVRFCGEQISLGDQARRRDQERQRRAREMATTERQQTPPPTAAQMRTATEAFRKTHEHGPPVQPNPTDAPICQPDDAERLSGMTADPTTEEDP